MLSKRIILILMILLISCFSLTFVSASQENITCDELAMDENINIESSVDDEVLIDDSDNFTELNNIITTDGNEIKLEKNYTYCEDYEFMNGISIANITIDGQGHAIDGNHEASIFKISSFNSIKNTITLKNIKFINAKTSICTEGEMGHNCDIQIINCTFINNSIGNHASGICLMETDTINLFVENSKFIGNDYGAIYLSELNHNCTVLNCEFINNSGTVIDLTATQFFFARNCSFINNKKNAISSFESHHISIEDTLFIDNEDYAVSISTTDFVSIENVTCENNHGVAIYLSECYTVISNSTFTNNTSEDNGGALNTDRNDALYVSNTKFINNTATECGGAIYSEDNVDDCIISIVNCDFTNNTAIKSGGAIYSTDGKNIVCDSRFVKNSASEGGAIYLYKSIYNYLTVSNCNFTDNNASEGGAIYSSDFNEVSVEKSSFINNSKTFHNTSTNKFDINGSKVIENGTVIYGDVGEDIKSNVTNFTDKNDVGGKGNAVDGGKSHTIAKTKKSTKIIAKKATFKKSKKVKKYTVTLKAGKKAVAKVRIYLKIKGKTYKATTKSNGKSTFKIKLNKKGTFVAKISFKGNKNYKPSTKKVKIKIK